LISDSKQMSTESAAAADIMVCCASCGIAEVDDIKLKMCNGGCDLMKYCSDECQNNNKEQHEESCRKRAAELRDKELLTQPDSSHLGDCPICFLPLPIDERKSTMMPCCSKLICDGCNYANQKREFEAGLEQRCAFCREPLVKTEEEERKRWKKRVKKNDPVAMYVMGRMRHLEGDYDTAIKYWTRAAELGDAMAHHVLSVAYYDGKGVEQNKEKFIYHSEQAAIAGHPEARHNIGIEEWNNDRFDRAKKHFIIAANLGCHESLRQVMELCADGHASKEDYANALRAYQVAVDAMASKERGEAEKVLAIWKSE